MNTPLTIETIAASDLLRRGIRRGLEGLAPIEDEVRPIIEDVRNRGDRAVRDYTERFDGTESVPSGVEVTPGEIRRAYTSCL